MNRMILPSSSPREMRAELYGFLYRSRFGQICFNMEKLRARRSYRPLHNMHPSYYRDFRLGSRMFITLYAYRVKENQMEAILALYHEWRCLVQSGRSISAELLSKT